MSDAKLERAVRDQLVGDSSVDPSRIRITAADGTVILSGIVDTLHQKMRARDDAARLTGVREVRNELTVDKSLNRVHDGDLKATAEAGLDANGLLPKGAITVDVADGWVTLTGKVPRYSDRQAAVHVARHLTGVQGVTDKVTVAPAPSADVADAISAALGRSAAVDAGAVKVSEVDGAVTLTGSVKTLAESDEAEQAASSAPGVVSVTNELVVTG